MRVFEIYIYSYIYVERDTEIFRLLCHSPHFANGLGLNRLSRSQCSFMQGLFVGIGAQTLDLSSDSSDALAGSGVRVARTPTGQHWHMCPMPVLQAVT